MFLPKFAAELLNGELSDNCEVLDQLVKRFDTMQGKSKGRHEVNLWMGCVQDPRLYKRTVIQGCVTVLIAYIILSCRCYRPAALACTS